MYPELEICKETLCCLFWGLLLLKNALRSLGPGIFAYAPANIYTLIIYTSHCSLGWSLPLKTFTESIQRKEYIFDSSLLWEEGTGEGENIAKEAVNIMLHVNLQ